MNAGQSIVIKGELSAGEDMVIAGRVEGTITLNGRTLTLAPGSEVIGHVSAGTVVVSGTVNGTLKAEQRLEVQSTAVVDGEVMTPALVVAEGSHMCAKVEMPARTAPRLAAVS